MKGIVAYIIDEWFLIVLAQAFLLIGMIALLALLGIEVAKRAAIAGCAGLFIETGLLMLAFLWASYNERRKS